MILRMIGVLAVWLTAFGAVAEPVRAPGQIGGFADRSPLFAVPAGPGEARVVTASLFAGPQDGLFAPRATPLTAPRAGSGLMALRTAPSGPYASQAARIRDLIARAEAGRAGYDAVQYGARKKPPRPPTLLTLGEIYDWIAATPGQPHAIGRYQFIPKTLRWLAAREGLGRDTRFTPAVQDRLADLLLVDAGLGAVQAGQMTRATFMDNLAKTWAGLPTASGRSFYHGYAGNKATMSHAEFDRQVRDILSG